MKCPSFESQHCRSCDLLDRAYAETLTLKEKRLREVFSGSPAFELKPTVGLSRDAEHSRTKAKLAVFETGGEIRFGFFDSAGIPKELENCPLHFEGINELLPVVRELLKKHAIAPYDLARKSGELKYLLISKSDTHSEILVRFVLRSKAKLEALRELARELQERNARVRVVTANIQPVHQAVLEGNEELVLTKESVIHYQFDEFTLTLGPRSFFQVTPELARELYRTLAREIARDRPESLLDLYCGVGAFSFYASRSCARVKGVELSSDAIACALESKELNRNERVEFQALDVEAYLKSTEERFEAVLVNPPRRGLNEKIIADIRRIEPRFIYYSSCNVETLARDQALFRERYELRSLQIFDLFPYTAHFETFAVFSRN